MSVHPLEIDELQTLNQARLRHLLAETDSELHYRIRRDAVDEALVTLLVNWLRLQAVRAGARGYTLGISGGIDSAVTAALVERATAGANRYVWLPIQSAGTDREAARLVADALGLDLETVDLNEAYAQTARALGANPDEEPTPLHLMNLKAMVRMAALSTIANQHALLVAGTGNRSELEHAGFFTKRGDGAADNVVLGHLFKAQVRAVARLLGVPEEIVTRPPTPGLRLHPDGTPVTDEQEMGLLYAEIEKATRLFMEFGANLGLLEEGVRERYPEDAERVLTVCKRLGLRSWRNRHKIDPVPIGGYPREARPLFEDYPNGFPTLEQLRDWGVEGN